MIDWITFRAIHAQKQPLRGGYVASVTLDHDTGEERVEWVADKRIPVAGSHDQRITIKSAPHDPINEIEISGNPAKFLQGHNVFGSDDLVGLAAAMYRGVLSRLGLAPTPAELVYLDAGGFTLTRVDVTYSFDLQTLPRVLSAIRGLESSAHLRHRGRGQLTKGNTLYFGQKSRRSSLKFYAKGQELRDHRLPDALLGSPLQDYADRLLRAECTFRGMWLKDKGLQWGASWTPTTPKELHRDMLENLSIAEAFMLDPDTIAGLPPRLQAVYQLWKDGHDLRAMYPKPTFYRYRSELVKHGIDIAVKQPREESNVVRLPVVLHAHQVVDIPAWAIGTPLYVEPRRAVG